MITKEIVNLLREILYELRHINEMMTEDKDAQNVQLVKNTVISNSLRTKR